MPLYYDPKAPAFPGEEISGRDLRINLDIGGDQKIKDLRPDEQLFANMGSAITDTVRTGISFGSKIPLLKETVELIGNSPIGAAIGGVMTLAQIPSDIIGTGAALVRQAVTGREDLPADIQRMLAAGASEWDVAQYMVKTQRAWSDSQEANLMFSLLTDPLTYLTAGVGKIGALKPIAGLAGGTAGAVAGGAALGTMGLGPIGTVGGGIVGGVLASRKAGQFATRAMTRAEAIGRVANRAASPAAKRLIKKAVKAIPAVEAVADAKKKLDFILRKASNAEDRARILSTPDQVEAAVEQVFDAVLDGQLASGSKATQEVKDAIIRLRGDSRQVDDIQRLVASGRMGAEEGKAAIKAAEMADESARKIIEQTFGGLKDDIRRSIDDTINPKFDELAAVVSPVDEAAEIAAIGGELTSAEKLAMYLNKPRGLDLANRLAIGRDSVKQISKYEKILASARKRGDVEQVRAAEKAIEDAKVAIDNANAIDDGVMYGIYDVYKTVSSAASKQGKSMFGAAFTVPASMMIQRTMGGLRLNERVERYGRVFGPEMASNFSELVGRGMSTFGIIGMQSVVSGSNAFRAKNIAERIAKTYFDAKADLGTRLGRGASVQFTPDEIITQMRENVLAEAAARGGDSGLVGMFDTNNIDELRKRIEYLSTVDNRAAALTPGRSTIPQIKALASYIESELNIGDIQAIRTAGGSFEKTLVRRIAESGPDEFAKAGIDQINNRMQSLVFDVRNKATAKTMFMAHVKSATIGLGKSWDDVAKQWEEIFEERFGKFYDEAGNVRKEDDLTKAAEEMLFAESIGYSGATSATVKYNTLVERVAAKDPALIKELGKEVVDELSSVFSQTGKINLVGRNHLFYDKVAALTRSYKIIVSMSDDLEKDSGAVAPETANVLEDGLPSTIATRSGDQVSVSILRRQIKALRRASIDEGEDYVRLLTKLDSQLASAKNLDDARRIWGEIANAQLDDVRAFGQIKSHKEIYEFLIEAERQGLAVHKLPDSKLALVGKALKAIGYDESFIAGLRSGAYRVVEAPKTNKIYKPALIDTPGMTPDQMRLFASKVVPFVDMSDNGIIAAGKRMVPDSKYKASFLQEFGTKMFSPIPQKYVTASIKRRLGAFLARGGLTNTHMEAILDELIERGIAKGVSARGLTTPEHFEAFKAGIERIGGPGSYRAFIDNYKANTFSKAQEFDPTAAVMYAFRGDKSVVGATQYMTGGLKMWAPSIAKFTDDLYPTIKFKANPLYYIQEYLESPTLNSARGVDSDTVASISRDGQISSVTGAQLRNLSDVGPETQNYLDNVNFLAVFRNDAIAQAATGRYDDVVAATGLWENIRRGRSLGKLAQAKEKARDALALDLTAKTFSDTLREKDYTTWAALSKHYGTTDSRTIFTNYVNYRLRLGDERRVWSDIEASRPAGVGFNRIPDPDGQVRFLAKQELLTGGRFSPEDAALAGNTGALTEAQLFDLYVQRPHIYRAELDKHLISMEDAGYDMTVLNPAGQKLRNALNRLENDLRSGAGLSDETMAMVTAAREDLRQAFNLLDEGSIELVHKQSAMRTLASASGMIDPNSMDDLTELVIQTMLVGKGFTVEAQNVIDAVNRSILAAKRAGINPRTQGRAFSEAVSTAMRGEIAANKRLVDVFSKSAVEMVSTRSAEETVYNAFQYAYTKALEQANKTTYYASERSFFERTINHPMLAFYPYSYMFKKILPEMTQFLFKGAFGAKAPLAGYSAYMNVRDYVEAQIEQDPSFRKALEDKADVMYMMTMLFPGVPWDISVVPPAWARNVYKRMLTTKETDPVELSKSLIVDDVFRTFFNIGPAVSIPIMGEALSGALRDDGPKPIRRIPSAFPSELD